MGVEWSRLHRRKHRKKIVAKMTKDNWDPKLFKTIIKDGFYDIDTLKEKYGLKIESELNLKR